MAAFLINTPEPMMKVRVIAIKDQSQKALERLQDMGVLHIEEASDLSPLDRDRIETERRRIREALNLLDEIILYLPGPRTVFVGDAAPGDTLSRVFDEVGRLHRSFGQTIGSYTRKKEELNRTEKLDRYLGLLGSAINPVMKDLRYSGNYLFSRVVVLTEETFRIFQDKTAGRLLRTVSASSEEEGMLACYFIAAADSRKQIESITRDLGISILDIPETDEVLSDFLDRNRRDGARLQDEVAALQEKIATEIAAELERIALYREILSAEFGRYSVLLQAAEARYVTLIEGWAPERSAGAIEADLKESVGNVFTELNRPSPVDQPPTKLQNREGIRPFEVIVRLFSLPRYGDWDPTPSVAYFFAFFFGLMLNDFVYALGLLFLAKFVLDKLVEEPDSEGTQLFRRVLYTSGFVALVFSILSGTYLGDFPEMYLGIDLLSLPLVATVQTILANPILFIVLALILGIIHVNLAHVLATIKAVRERDAGTIINKIGLFMIQIFGIPAIVYSMFNIALIPVDTVLYGFFIYPVLFGVLLIIAGSLVKMGALGSFVWIFDLTGILGDIMSYSRLAGVGLATFYLAAAFNLLSGWVAQIAGSIIPGIPGQVAAIIIGTILLFVFHTFNLFLSSLAAFIHSLRLCFVEYLLKFYEGGGREYTPFHMRFRREVVIGK